MGNSEEIFMLFFIPCAVFSPSNWETPLFLAFSTLLLYFFVLVSLEPKSVTLLVCKCCWVVHIVVSGASGAYSESTD